MYLTPLLKVYSYVFRAFKYQDFFFPLLLHSADISEITYFPGCELSTGLGGEVIRFESWLGCKPGVWLWASNWNFPGLSLLICNLKMLILCLAWVVRIHDKALLAQACAEALHGRRLLWWWFWPTNTVNNLCFTLSFAETITQENTRVSHYPVSPSTTYSSKARMGV